VAKLFLISTPIGNLKDITIRALETLSACDIILCEDTRETQKIVVSFPDYFRHKPQFLSYNDFTRDRRIPEVLQYLVQDKDVALVSDRGTPLISDPGYKLVREVIRLSESQSSIQIDSVPGANAVLTALQLSGLPPDKFFFVGFLPKKPKAKQDLLKELPATTIIAYESPFRVLETLEDISNILGDNTEVAVCSELTKLHQKIVRATAGELLNQLEEVTIKGEITLVFRKE
jgi:16S rRNA (cytidine1402-2'-O)-methyltransferase